MSRIIGKGIGQDFISLLPELAINRIRDDAGRVDLCDTISEFAFHKGIEVHSYTRISCPVYNGKGSTPYRLSMSLRVNASSIAAKAAEQVKILPCSLFKGKRFDKKTIIQKHLCKEILQND
jgi:hypothetical protein